MWPGDEGRSGVEKRNRAVLSDFSTEELSTGLAQDGCADAAEGLFLSSRITSLRGEAGCCAQRGGLEGVLTHSPPPPTF